MKAKRMEEERPITERRITQRVFNYWLELCNGRDMPEESDIEPEALGKDWPNCFLLQTRDIEHINQFNFTYLGEGIIRGYEQAGLDPNNPFLVGPNAFYLAPHFHHVVVTHQPLIESSHFFADDGTKILYRQCLLPMSSTPDRVEAVFGAMLFKVETAARPRRG
ncbi:MAG: PAS domain-containing protein [Rickettsiales bacterium]